MRAGGGLPGFNGMHHRSMQLRLCGAVREFCLQLADMCLHVCRVVLDYRA
jgi:hypothetical protein